MSNSERALQTAQRRVKELRDFYVHLTVYILVIALLIIINLVTSPNFYWFLFPLGGWGIAVVLHALRTFGGRRFFGPEGEARKMDEFLSGE